MTETFFIAHQFTTEMNDDLRNAIAEGLQDTGLRPVYGNDAYKSSHLLEKLNSMICNAAFTIFDITDANPNVFLELGIAISSRKPYYILCRAGTSIPANISGIDRIEYKSIRQLIHELGTKVAPRWKRPESDLPSAEITRKCVRLYEVERLFHRVGEGVTDEEANNNRAWKFGPEMDIERSAERIRFPHAVFGPYESLPQQGLYKAYYRLKVNTNSRPDDLLHIEILSQGNPGSAKIKGSRKLRGFDFALPNQYQEFAISFGYGTENDLEYRIRQCSDGVTVHADYVAIVDCTVENALER